MAITIESELGAGCITTLRFLRDRGWGISIADYAEEMGEMEVTTPDDVIDYYHGDVEILTFFRSIALYLDAAE